jgi:hypothetical protein
MTVLDWLALLGSAVAIAAFSLLVYRFREPPVRGRVWLGLLRAAALLLLVFLLIDPAFRLPGQRRVPTRAVLLDASFSMLLPAGPGEPARWPAAVDAASAAAGGADVVLFGARPRTLDPGRLDDVSPADPRSLLAPALRAAVEAGAERAHVVTDGGLEDAAEAVRWAERLGLPITFESVRHAAAGNRSLVEVEAPPWTAAGSTAEIRVAVAADTALPPGSSVQVWEAGRMRAQAPLEPGAAGALSVATLRLVAEAPTGGGLVRYDLVLEPRDAFPDDDVRTIYVHVSERPAGVTLVSFWPDWEPRFLAPVLERSLGMPLRAYLRVAEGRYLRLATGGGDGVPAPESEVRAAVEAADLVVLHGPARAPAWAVEAARRARRLLVFADDATPAGLVPAAIGAARDGDWYLAEPLPPSPLGGALAGMPLEALPPLRALRDVSDAPGAVPVLMAAAGRRGPPQPVLVQGEGGGRRWAVALAHGYWTWALRGGESRAAYHDLWAAVTGWLTRDAAARLAEPIRPAHRVLARGLPIAWIAQGLAPDSISIRLADDAGRVQEFRLAARRDTAFSPPVAPAHYRFEAVATRGGQQLAAGSGVLTVESWSPEFVRPSHDLVDVTPDRRLRPHATRRPFRTSTLPWLLLLGLLAAEWVLRRRWGLR